VVARGAGPGAAPLAPIVIKELKDILVSDVTVKGVLQNGSSYLAMVQGPNGKTYVAHVGDSLRNGTIRSITPQGMVIVQNINDPLTTQSQREVRKLLRSFDEAK
jgi:Tfp pilus assembly protein PilP